MGLPKFGKPMINLSMLQPGFDGTVMSTHLRLVDERIGSDLRNGDRKKRTRRQ